MSLKGRTLYLYTLNQVQKVVNSLELGYILIQQKACLILSLVNSLARLIQARVLLIRGSRYQSFFVRRFNFLKLIQKQRDLSSFLTKRTRAINRAQLDLIKPLSRFLIRYFLTTSNSSTNIRYSGQNLRLEVKAPFLSLIQ